VLKFAVCDDLTAEANALKNHIERYAREKTLRVEVDAYSEAQAILGVLARIAEYDLVFLDIYMERLNGIDLARQLREQGDKSRIIFFSTSKEHALDAFGVNASNYLVKPVSYDKLASAIDAALEQRLEQEASIKVITDHGGIEIRLRDLVYAEAQRNYQHLFLASGSMEKVRMTGSELYSLLEGRPEFVRLGASFIINLRYVNTVTAHEVALAGRYSVPVPRGSYTELKQKYLNFFLSGGEG